MSIKSYITLGPDCLYARTDLYLPWGKMSGGLLSLRLSGLLFYGILTENLEFSFSSPCLFFLIRVKKIGYTY